jgi:urease beta subunit
VLSGSLAIENAIAYASARLGMVYVDQAPDAIERLDLRPVDSGANVLLAATNYNVVFERSQAAAGVRLAAKSQVAVDLLTAPGRGPSEAQALLDWMSTNESSWRAA